MPLDVQLKKKLADDIWLASGRLTNSAGANFPAEVLVKNIDGETAELVLNSALYPSIINGKNVLSYFNETTANAEKGFKPNVKIQFNHFSVKLK